MRSALFLFFMLLFVLIPPAIGQDTDAHFSYAASETALSAEIVKSADVDSLVHFEKVVLGGLDSKIPFYHYLNQRRSGAAYVILIHGLGGNKDYWVNPSMPYLQYTRNLTSIKDSLLHLGYSLLIVDAKYHGERSYELDFRDPASLPPMRSQNVKDATSFYNMFVSSVKEIRLIMDYIERRMPDRNPVFNLVGYSMGGAISLTLNSIEDRIRCVVACVPPLSRPFSEIGETNFPEALREDLKAVSPLYGATNQKNPVILLMGKTDFFISVEEAQNYFDTLSIPEKQLKFYDSGHELPDAYVGDVIGWIERHNR